MTIDSRRSSVRLGLGTVMIALAVVLAGLMPGSATARTSAPAAAGHSAAFTYKTFHSPSGNIRCAIVKSGGRWSIRCDIFQRYWNPPPKNCQEGDNAGSVLMGGKSRPRFICVSDVVSPAGKKLKYGHTLSYGAFLCKSKRSGLRCWNRLGRSFKLSREFYRFWY